MATYHMDTAACRGLQASLTQLNSQMDENIQRLSGAVGAMIGSTWITPAANQALTRFTENSAAIHNQAAQLDELARSLGAAVAAWEEAAAHF